MKTILYVHGLGGGGDSRIPGILSEYYARNQVPVRVICKTYDFDPEKAAAFLAGLAEEMQPDLVIGESLGAAQALRIPLWRTEDSGTLKAVPHLFVSPSLGAPLWLGRCAFLALIPGVRPLFNYLYRPKHPGDRQVSDFRFGTLKKYRAHYRKALATAREGLRTSEATAARSGPVGKTATPPAHPYFAFFGTRDHYRKSGVVSVRRWEKLFGKASYALYDGTHFMEEEYIRSMLIPRIDALLHL